MKDISWITYVMLILASYRLTHLIVFDKITEFIRGAFLRKKTVKVNGHMTTKKEPTSMFGYLLNCYWCAGVWISAIVGVFFLLLPKVSEPVIFIFSIAGAQAILETFAGVAVKSVQYLSSRTEK